MKAIAIVSGGMDSVTLAYLLKSQGHELTIVSIDYGQRHVKEIEYARRCADRLSATFHLVDLSQVGALLPGSALTDNSIEVPEGHYAADNMRVTVVPNRNAIMLALAYGIAVAEQASIVATAVHSGDHHIYPDCRLEFIEAFDKMERLAVAGFADTQLLTPFVNMTKAEIVAMGASLGVPFVDTWSCYKGGAEHCGKCGTCVERREAFHIAGVIDPTIYTSR